MAESPAETARIQMQSDRARGVSLHRPCPALCLPGYRGYPVPLVRPWPDLLRPSTPSRPLSEPRSKTWVAGTSPAKGISGCTERAMEQPISLNRTAVGQAPGLV